MQLGFFLPIVVLGGQLLAVQAHTSLKLPLSREGGKGIVEDPTNEIGCSFDYPYREDRVTAVTAGQELKVEYYRNNHVGGFVRYAIIKRGEPETRENFDQNVFHLHCREIGDRCRPSYFTCPSDAGPATQCTQGDERPYTFWDSDVEGPARFSASPYDGAGELEWQITCDGTIRIPDYLEDGDYVLQFTNFGTGHSKNNPGLSTPTYRSCADLRITGGNSQTHVRPQCPTFQGGDRVTRHENKGNQCAYFNSNEIPEYQFQEEIPYDQDKDAVGRHYKIGIPADIERCQATGKNGNGTRPQLRTPNAPGVVHALTG